MERDRPCTDDLLDLGLLGLAERLERAVWSLSRARGVSHNTVRLELGLPVRRYGPRLEPRGYQPPRLELVPVGPGRAA